MDSDDDLSSIASAPNAKTITAALRNAVQKQYAEDVSKATVKLIRARVEKGLDLATDFLKNDSFWKEESKSIIKDEAEKQNALADAAELPTSQREPTADKQPPIKVTKKPTKKRASKAKKAEDGLSDGVIESPKEPSNKAKGASASKSATRRARAKPIILDDEDEEEVRTEAPEKNTPEKANESGLSEFDESPKRPVKRTKTSPAKLTTPKKAKKTHETAAKEDNGESGKAKPSLEKATIDEVPGSGSEMSVVLDPTPQKKPKSSSSATGTSKKQGKTKISKPRSQESSKKGSSKTDSNLSPDEEKIKTLQQWLLKCGIRKFWSKELAKFDTPKEKIKHLTGLLTAVGMTPRYSIEKAKRIKEERELQAEVEAVQESAGWAKMDNGRVNTRSSRSAPTVPAGEKKQIRGMEDLAFLDDQSDSE